MVYVVGRTGRRKMGRSPRPRPPSSERVRDGPRQCRRRPWDWCHVAAKFIISNSKFLVFNAKFIIFTHSVPAGLDQQFAVAPGRLGKFCSPLGHVALVATAVDYNAVEP